MSLFPKSEWMDRAREWGMEHLPQKGRLFRDESVVGIRDGRLVQVGWGGENRSSLVVLIRFPRVERIERLRDALIADPALDTLPGKAAKRRKVTTQMTSKTSPIRKRRRMPEFTLNESALRWVRQFPISSPKSATVRTWVETLLGAIGRATHPFDGHCERCNAANLRGFVLVDGIPMILCSCQQHLRAEGEMAERSYELQVANHMAGAVLAPAVAVVGAIAWAIMAAVTGEIYAAVAIVTGLVVGRAYRRGAGRVDASGRLMAFTDLKKLAQAVANQIPTNVRLATVAHSKAYRPIRRARGARL
jgi:hypothetical protein